MKKTLLIIIMMLLMGNIPAIAYQSLWEVYDEAGGSGEYDKWLDLDPSIEYLGNLNITTGLNVYINGHGALIHGRINTGAICVSGSHLDIENCVIIDGHAGLYIGSGSSAIIKNNTITGMTDSGIRTFYIGIGANTQIYDNIITDCYYGYFGIENEIPGYIGFNTVYNTISYRYAEFCPG
ncbi:MAG: right-handed parallel beta-helix repeat-containing protein [candidate division Zixibacteria bacterium]|nr:right-handed parallel beta-helix repeat-containing protein [candidate division Zixibacteria bacterium]